MGRGGRGYPQAGPVVGGTPQDPEITVVSVEGEPIYDELVRLGEHTISMADLLSDDEGYPRGVRGWRLA